ncbi:MAG: hypothetical protein ABI905_01280 [Betaproteobacteria bacterium]
MSATGTDHDTHVDDPSNGGSSQANPAKAAKRAEAKDTHSWHVLLGPNLDGKLLCVDSTPGEHGDFFSQLGAIVHTLDLGAPGGHLSPDLWLKRLANHLETDWASAPDAAQFDGFIFHDLAARVLRVGDAELISRLLRAVHRLLKPGGFCYVGFLNSRALFRRTPAGNAGLGPATIRRAFRDAGFAAANFRLHPYLLERDSVLEILPVRGYTSVKNSRLTSERVKEWCYGRFGSQRWAPGYGAVAFKDQAPCSVVDMLARELEKLPEARGGALHMLRAQVLRRKIIFSFGRGDEKYGQLVVVYSRDPQSIDRRAAESAILLRLVKRMPALRDSVPRFVSQGAIGRYQYFALTEFAGMTIDRPSAGTEVAKRNAVAWLSNFHRTTIEWNASPAGELNEVATSFFEHC